MRPMGVPTSPAAATSRQARGGLVAREAELDALRRFVAQEGVAALVLEGPAGIGKTSLWESGVQLARDQGLRVLVARASDAETGMPFAALVDLLEDVDPEELAPLPGPQRNALDVALYRAHPTDALQPHAIAVGLLAALRSLAVRGRVLVAVDDSQWLDRASEEALSYAARRLDPAQALFLLARRRGWTSGLEGAFRAGSVERLSVAPASLGATRHILADRLELRLPHHLLRRVYDATAGNPLFVLEVGRVLASRDGHFFGVDLPVPDDVEDLLGTRVADLDPAVRRGLLALALDADLRAADLDGLVGAETVLRAVTEGVLVTEGGRVRAAHPLLAAAAARTAVPSEREALHRDLAEVVTDHVRRTLHLALATSTPDEELAGALAGAADQAAARGAPVLGAELATHALRLTTPGSADGVRRLLGLGEHLAVAGEKQRLTELLAGRVADLPPGQPRVTGYLLLTNGVVVDNDDIRRLMQRALAEAGDDPQLRAPVLAELSRDQAVISVLDVPGADRGAEEALAAAAGGPADDHQLALTALAWTRALRGRPVDDLCEQHRALSGDPYFARSPERVAGQRFVWRGEVGPARELLTSLMATAEERGQPSPIALHRLHLCELALRTGSWDDAEVLLDEWGSSTDSFLLHWPMYERCRALLAAGRGDPDEARRWGAEAVARAEATKVRWDWLEAKRALGLAALLAKDLDAAVRDLSAVWAHTERQGVGDPGAFPVAPDLVEALVDAGEHDQARAVTVRLAEVGRTQDHPWAALAAQRSAAVLALVGDGYDDAAGAALQGAASAYQQLALAFDHARTLLVLGRAQRRARKWGAAVETLESARAAFADLGSPGWVADAQAELERVGARRAAGAGRLSPTERRVAHLAAEGLSNKEIARTLVVTVNTVEFHLRNTYAKLGLRSRVQLAARLADEDATSRT